MLKEDRFLKFVENPENIRRILVIRNGLIGDTVFMTPVLERLRENFRDASVDVAISVKSTRVLENCSHINKIFPIPTDYSFLGHAAFFFSLRKFHYDIAIIQEVNSHYVLMSKLLGAKYIAGFKNSLSFLLDHAVPRPAHVHTVLAELETVKGWTNSISPVATHLEITENEEVEAREILRSNGVSMFDSIVSIHPGCSGTRSLREWLPEHYGTLADLLIENAGVEIVFCGVEQDRRLIEKIVAGMKNRHVSIAGKTNLRQLFGVLKLSRVVVSPDTGTAHIANAVGTPAVMLFGPSDPVDTGPVDPSGRSAVVRADLPCIGCFHRDPKPAQWEVCKTMYPPICMRELDPQVVYEVIAKVLEKSCNK